MSVWPGPGCAWTVAPAWLPPAAMVRFVPSTVTSVGLCAAFFDRVGLRREAAKTVLRWAAYLAQKTHTPMPWFLNLPLTELALVIIDLSEG